MLYVNFENWKLYGKGVDCGRITFWLAVWAGTILSHLAAGAPPLNACATRAVYPSKITSGHVTSILDLQQNLQIFIVIIFLLIMHIILNTERICVWFTVIILKSQTPINLLANSADDKLIICFLFSLKIGFDYSCISSPEENRLWLFMQFASLGEFSWLFSLISGKNKRI